MDEQGAVGLTPEKQAELHESILTSAYVREMFQSEGMKRLRNKIDGMTGKQHSKWLLAKTTEEAEKIRQECYGYEMFFDLAKRVMIAGDMAKQILERSKAE